jgi:UDP-glucuronate decarboxylase
MNILVTGGAGFIGSHLIRTLLLDHSVTCLDNLYTGNRSNFRTLLSHPRFTFIEADIVDPLPRKITNTTFDQIYNLACPASPVHYQARPLETFKASVIGILNLLELASHTGARLLQASTSEVYGDPIVHPQPESYWGNVNPIGIRSCYDEGKRAAETLCFDYERVHHAQVRVARIFNTYGPNMLPNDGRVVSNFIVQALEGKPLSIYGDGTQTRSFCYVTDLVDGLIRLMSLHTNPGPVNLGNPNEFTMLELAEKVLKVTNSSSTINHHSLPEDDPKVRQPIIEKAIETLGWRPKVELDEGLIQTVGYFSKLSL